MAAATVHDIKFPEPIQQSPKSRDEFDRHVLLLKEYTGGITDYLIKTDKIDTIAPASIFAIKSHLSLTSNQILHQKQKNLEKIIRKVSQYYEHGALRFTDAFEVELRLAEAEVVLFASQKVSDYTKAA